MTYQVNTHKRTNRTFHVNMLRGWNSPAETAGLAEEIADVGEDDEVHCWKDKGQVCFRAQLW